MDSFYSEIVLHTRLCTKYSTLNYKTISKRHIRHAFHLKFLNIPILKIACTIIFDSRLVIAALWSPEGKGLSSWPFVYDVDCDVVTFPFGILGQVWYLIVTIPNPCCLSYFESLRQFVGIRLL